MIRPVETTPSHPHQTKQYLYELGWHTKGQIAITEPRRVAAMTLADRVATERGEILGQTVGVSISFVDRCSEQTHIKVRATGHKAKYTLSVCLTISDSPSST